ncbi:glucosamine-6-phosphate deaminase [Propioniciclava soli]|uniref:glucosamine-6-phosphate deaminase n=1 Tax=Propioniciclava soli TaxID=2775081 RepID=UPI001E42D16D|nr:glucosamine-6-phosphate deaminase [Propioniciclava soli]
MEVIICPDAEAVAQLAAAKVERVARDRGPQPVIGVATGSSPVALYDALAARVASGELDLSDAHAFALDEYVGLPPGHPESYEEVIRRTVTEPLGLDPARVHVPDGRAQDLEAAAAAYEDAIAAAGGVDVQILGIGSNGHVGFNEPTSSLASRTRIKTLTARTRFDNARFFASADEVPTHCLTQGLGTIMAAHEVVLVAQGDGKADAVAGLVEGPITAMVPGSVLQLHRRATVVVDEAAAAKLQLAEYYRETYERKPDWQRFRTGL